MFYTGNEAPITDFWDVSGFVTTTLAEQFKAAVVFVEPPGDAAPGDRVLLEGAEAVPPASGNQMKKKKIMEKAAADLRAVDTVATYRGTPLTVAGGPCKSPSVPAGTIN